MLELGETEKKGVNNTNLLMFQSLMPIFFFHLYVDFNEYAREMGKKEQHFSTRNTLKESKVLFSFVFKTKKRESHFMNMSTLQCLTTGSVLIAIASFSVVKCRLSI